MNANINKWRENYSTILSISIIAGLVISFFSYLFLGEKTEIPTFILFCGMIFLSALIAYILFNLATDFAKKSTVKFFLVDVDIAQQVILNVLDAKNIPYTLTEKEIQLDSIQIRVGKGALNRGAITGTFIAIGPYQGSNRLLVESLKKKIDEAFMPQGLNRLKI